MRTILLMVPDLLMGVKATNIVSAAGGNPKPVRSADDFLAALQGGPPAAVVLDLNTRGDLTPLIRAAAEANVPSFVFISHTDGEGVARARAAGASKVVSNGAMAGALPGWLEGVLAGQATPGNAG